MAKAQTKIPSLDGLRALSILTVLIGHQSAKLKLNFAFGGQLGVTIFFVISGFLITLLLLKEEEKNGTISLKNFYIRRTIRIFPVYYFLLFVYFILEVLEVVKFSKLSWITSLTYTKYFGITELDDWESGHLWSLSVEEHFYLIWPTIFYFFKKYKTSFAISIIILVPIARLVTSISAMHLFTRADSLMWGCLFAIYYDPILAFIKKQKGIFLIFPFILLVSCLAVNRISGMFFNNTHFFEQLVIVLAGTFGTFTNMCIGLIIIISINYRENIWFKFLNTRLLNYIGVLSYSIYIWQQLFFSNNLGKLSEFPFNIVLIFLAAIISYNFIELPFLKLKDRLQSKNKTVLPKVTTAEDN